MVTDSVWNHTHLFLLVCILQLSFLKTHWARKSNLVIWTVRLLTGISKAVVSWGLMFAPLHCSTASTSQVEGCILFWELKISPWIPDQGTRSLYTGRVSCWFYFLLAETEGVGLHFWQCLNRWVVGVLPFFSLFWQHGNKDLNRFRQLLRIPGYRME